MLDRKILPIVASTVTSLTDSANAPFGDHAKGFEHYPVVGEVSYRDFHRALARTRVHDTLRVNRARWIGAVNPYRAPSWENSGFDENPDMSLGIEPVVCPSP